MKGTGAKRNVCPGSCVSTGAKFPVAPVESAPMNNTTNLFSIHCNHHFANLKPLQFPCIFFDKYIYIAALETANPGNQNCANCIGTLSFPISATFSGRTDQWVRLNNSGFIWRVFAKKPECTRKGSHTPMPSVGFRS